MIKPAWYLIDTDFFAEPVPDSAGPDTDEAASVLAAAEAILSDEGSFDPAYTVIALRLGLTSAVRLLDTATHATAILGKDDLVRFVHGLALLHAYLTQTVQRLADHTRILAAAGSPTAAVSRRASDALCAAGDGGEFLSGDLKRAYLALLGPDRS